MKQQLDSISFYLSFVKEDLRSDVSGTNQIILILIVEWIK